MGSGEECPFPVWGGAARSGALRKLTDSSGVEGDSGSGNPAIPVDGCIVAFSSYATNLVPGDTN